MSDTEWLNPQLIQYSLQYSIYSQRLRSSLLRLIFTQPLKMFKRFALIAATVIAVSASLLPRAQVATKVGVVQTGGL